MDRENCPVTVLTDVVARKLTRSETKRAAIVQAAREVFLAKGFDIASMDQIAAVAGVSKRTVYFHFQSKDQLFANVMMEMCANKKLLMIGGETLETSTVLEADRPIEEALTEFGELFLQLIFEPQTMALLRILIGQTGQFPEIGREFFDQGPREMSAILSQYLDAAHSSGVIKLRDGADRVAGCFLSSLLTPAYLECLATACPPPSADKIRLMSETAVHLFLCGTLVDRSNCA